MEKKISVKRQKGTVNLANLRSNFLQRNLNYMYTVLYIFKFKLN